MFYELSRGQCIESFMNALRMKIRIITNIKDLGLGVSYEIMSYP